MPFDYGAIRPVLLDLMRARRTSVPLVAVAAGMPESTLRQRLSHPEQFRWREIDKVAAALGTTPGKLRATAEGQVAAR